MRLNTTRSDNNDSCLLKLYALISNERMQFLKISKKSIDKEIVKVKKLEELL